VGVNDGRPRALITGIDGQDGSYLAELLLGRGYDVWGTVHTDPDGPRPNLAAIRERLTVLGCDLRDRAALTAVIDQCRPRELYNFAAATFVPGSWDDPVTTVEVNATAVTAMLEAVRRDHPDTRVYQASSSEVFGVPDETPQSETTPLRPVNPYGIAKLHAQLSAGAYREHHGLHVSVGVTFNHESPRRPPTFVTRKVTRAVAAIKLGRERELVLGNLDARRDWGYAPDYVEAMWRMLQQDAGDDYVLATGRSHTVRDLVEVAFACAGLDPAEHVRVDPDLVRIEVGAERRGDPSRAQTRLGWEPAVSFEAMIAAMVDHDLELLEASPAAATTGEA
jgi:GDPmannose 4,6-dehydratase